MNEEMLKNLIEKLDALVGVLSPEKFNELKASIGAIEITDPTLEEFVRNQRDQQIKLRLQSLFGIDKLNAGIDRLGTKLTEGIAESARMAEKIERTREVVDARFNRTEQLEEQHEDVTGKPSKKSSRRGFIDSLVDDLLGVGDRGDGGGSRLTRASRAFRANLITKFGPLGVVIDLLHNIVVRGPAVLFALFGFRSLVRTIWHFFGKQIKSMNIIPPAILEFFDKIDNGMESLLERLKDAFAYFTKTEKEREIRELDKLTQSLSEQRIAMIKAGQNTDDVDGQIKLLKAQSAKLTAEREAQIAAVRAAQDELQTKRAELDDKRKELKLTEALLAQETDASARKGLMQQIETLRGNITTAKEAIDTQNKTIATLRKKDGRFYHTLFKDLHKLWQKILADLDSSWKKWGEKFRQGMLFGAEDPYSMTKDEALKKALELSERGKSESGLRQMMTNLQAHRYLDRVEAEEKHLKRIDKTEQKRLEIIKRLEEIDRRGAPPDGLLMRSQNKLRARLIKERDALQDMQEENLEKLKRFSPKTPSTTSSTGSSEKMSVAEFAQAIMVNADKNAAGISQAVTGGSNKIAAEVNGSAAASIEANQATSAARQPLPAEFAPFLTTWGRMHLGGGIHEEASMARAAHE